MYIVSKNKKSIVNMSQATVVYLGADNCTIKADYQNGNGCQLGRYDSEAAARAAIDMIAGSIEKTEVCYMPDDDAVKAKMNLNAQTYHHIAGKKSKGHGGS
ncbi:MAG: hypothetical protein NC517_09970 [Firmicutes bacterium]|nr:hypothetical protein [Bacillota bacterium]